MSTLIFAIVGEGKAEQLMQVAKKAGSTGGTILSGRSTASNSTLCLLGLGDTHTEILLTLVSDAAQKPVWDALSHTTVRGMLACVPALWDDASPIGEYESQWDMVNIICMSGYADDIMRAARKAGAGGGTIVEGRGTAEASDLAFFGSALVPGKEMLFVMVPKNLTDKVLHSINNLPCMQQKGSGIAFTYPLSAVAKLGK